jgi:hypothetical protein
MWGLLVDQHIAWKRIQEPQRKLLDRHSEKLLAEFRWQMDALHWQPRRDLSLPAEPDEGY